MSWFGAHRWAGPLALLVASGCSCAWISDGEEAARWDVDGDGLERPRDCDDDDPDTAGPVAWYRDADGDAFGDDGHTETACAAPAGFVADGGDCNDADPAVHPDAEEVCNGEDDDCSGTADDDVPLVTYYADADEDGYGDDDTFVVACAPPTGFVAIAGDCNDQVDAVNPEAEEICDAGVDNDCNGLADEQEVGVIDPAQTHWYPDRDDDLYGDGSATPIVQCANPDPARYVHDDTDCADEDLGILNAPPPELLNPGMPEICNGYDDDCNAVPDDNAVGAPTWYLDGDGDGFGAVAGAIGACTRPFGRVSNFLDCDDTLATVNPAAAEVCDLADNDCDTAVDDDDLDTVGEPTWFIDLDGDGFGDETFSSVRQCAPPPYYADRDGDCDDDDDRRNPAAAELCDDVDNDCDLLVDAADPDVSGSLIAWYLDGDGDGFGAEVQTPAYACDPPPQHVADNTDCNDLDDRSYPGAVEICDGLDNDCDADPDDGIDALWYVDDDGDGWGVTDNQIITCLPPPGRVSQAGDCDDADPANHPANPEVCDGQDNDCNGQADEDDSGLQADRWYADTDGDGHGDEDAVVVDCVQPPGHVALDDDCDDARDDVYKGALEVCDGVDNDCDTLTDAGDPTLDPTGNTWYRDLDADLWGSGLGALACSQPLPGGGQPPWQLDPGDCADDDPAIHPTAPELCDDLDNDCDTLVDDDDDELDPTSSRLAYQDADGDGQGDAATPWFEATCAVPAVGWVFDDRDCDDGHPDVYDGGPELCDGLDNDCDTDIDEFTPITWYEDADGDGQGNPFGATLVACTKPLGYAFRATDCNDASTVVYEGAPELCDSQDNDCDTLFDDADPDVVGTTWYLDSDEDGYGRTAGALIACLQPTTDTYATVRGDCDDLSASVNPAATEVCDFVDNDCDLAIDTDAVDRASWHPDDDDDGYGDGTAFQLACEAPPDHVLDDTDCRDDDFKIHPGAAEVCDGRDNDCDLQIDDDDDDVTNAVPWWIDADDDGFGTSLEPSVIACFEPAGRASNGIDCDDADAQEYPGAPEKCDGFDNDCDGTPDDNAFNRLWCPDVDGDGWGTSDQADCLSTCDPPADWVANRLDCDDTNPQMGPGQLEICLDGLDNDCDGYTDAQDAIAVGATPLYRDLDGDGFGDPNDLVFACGEAGFVDNDLDCDDADATVFTGAPAGPADLEDGVDRDCDGYDECYVDGDGDGFVGATIGPDDGDGMCTGTGEGLAWTDCEDAAPTAYPGAVVTQASVGDGIDQDCTGGEECFVDTDGDGSGQNVVTDDDGDFVCDDPGESADNDDCDDLRPTIYGGAPELCGDGLDNDCDGMDEATDPDVTPVPWYADRDLDGHGDPGAWVVACAQPQGFVVVGTDCDDTSPYAASRHPDQTETCDGYDDDCNGLVDGADPGLAGGPCADLPWFEADFTCTDGVGLAFDSVRNGYQAGWAGDLWSIDGAGTAGPNSGSTADTQGLPAQAAENFLLIGHSEWRNLTVEATVRVAAGETGAAGLVARYSTAANYTTCLITQSSTPGCASPVSVGPRAVLAKIDPNDPCVANDDYAVASAAWTYPNDTDIRMALEVSGGSIVCTIDADLDGVLGTGGDLVLSHTDASPLSSGRVGLAAFGLGPLGRFDDLVVWGQGVDQDHDGLLGGPIGPDSTDALKGLGTSDLDPDTDRDGALDRDEALNFRINDAFPPDTDGDGLRDALDPDSDGDGWSDAREAGDADPLTPPDDSDCDGAPDLRDDDSDDDGVPDAIDTCRTAPDPGQADLDADGLGDACDPTPLVADGDADGLLDGDELRWGADPADPDTDGDGLEDGDEALWGTDPRFPDSDLDALSDGDEVQVWATDPIDPDTDGGGVLDGREVELGTDPTAPTDG